MGRAIGRDLDRPRNLPALRAALFDGHALTSRGDALPLLATPGAGKSGRRRRMNPYYALRGMKKAASSRLFAAVMAAPHQFSRYAVMGPLTEPAWSYGADAKSTRLAPLNIAPGA